MCVVFSCDDGTTTGGYPYGIVSVSLRSRDGETVSESEVDGDEVSDPDGGAVVHTWFPTGHLPDDPDSLRIQVLVTCALEDNRVAHPAFLVDNELHHRLALGTGFQRLVRITDMLRQPDAQAVGASLELGHLVRFGIHIIAVGICTCDRFVSALCGDAGRQQ